MASLNKGDRFRAILRGTSDMTEIGYQWIAGLAVLMVIVPGIAEEVSEIFFESTKDGWGHFIMSAVTIAVVAGFYYANYFVARTFQRTNPQYRFVTVISIVSGVFALANFIPVATAEEIGNAIWIPLLGDIGFIGMGSVTIYAISHDLFSDANINNREVWGGIAVYILFGVIFSYLYGLIIVLETTSFSRVINPGIRQRPELLYVSLVIQTTIGFGDIVPQSTLAKSLVLIQGMFGMLYPPIFMARLVNLATMRRESGGEPRQEEVQEEQIHESD